MKLIQKRFSAQSNFSSSNSPTGLIREVFIRGGSGLAHSITAMFNAFKKNFDVPSQRDDYNNV